MVAPFREQLQESSLYRSFTLEEKHYCSYYSRQGDRWQFEKPNLKPNFAYLQIIPTNSIFNILAIGQKYPPFFFNICRVILFLNQAKKSSLVSGNRPGEDFLSPTHPHKSNVYENIYFLFQKKHTNKKFPPANLFVRIFPLKK